ncbi:type IV-A pilus assembly ATPase PilB [Thiopseudomonas alkaliphila]|uniref:Type IV-A pilus assembly ATPase PilB n=1 Tax=Thiopseudomonas alkaliphila TaxID=1697053 RepID=A0AAW7DTD1_9GAMM|nr:type IV-A pilus assembly ATPase PilB [Thiopseudomonas alkaliphila]MDM1697280.1 type IV-A pilus assembly ATPase PilB [Thiopseudomonas alkaliphila]
MDAPIKLVGLARQIVDAGLAEHNKVAKAVADAKLAGQPVIAWLVQHKLVKAKAVMELAADQFGVAYFDLNSFNEKLLNKELLSEKTARKHRVLPLAKKGHLLYVGLADPGDQAALNEIKFTTGLAVEAVLVEQDKLDRALDKLYDSLADSLGGLDGEAIEGLETESEQTTEEEQATDAADEAPIVRFVNSMLLRAIKMGSSDLHFEPYEHSYRVRFRTDGVLHEVTKQPVSVRDRISARLKVMASMDISERRKPQDGRIKLKLSPTKSIDFRVNTLPTLWGEKIVLRILDSDSAKLGIDSLGYEPEQKALYLEALEQPQGMILVTGPTGSGKTVSLYTGINIVNTVERNISTAEDPVEINLEGINQVNVNPKQGMDFSQALRAFLRQDPDVIMVGEIRDLETAEIAIKAAQTGHMVMSTLHTNSAAETLTRLRNMGVAAFNLATSVNLIIAQRLARRLCNSCKAVVEVPKETLLQEGFTEQQIGTFKVYGPVGCDNCNGGYKGRVGIYEVVKITPALQEIIMQDGNSIEIDQQMRKEGFNDLRRSALEKVIQGVTSLEEVNRVTKD